MNIKPFILGALTPIIPSLLIMKPTVVYYGYVGVVVGFALVALIYPRVWRPRA